MLQQLSLPSIRFSDDPPGPSIIVSSSDFPSSTRSRLRIRPPPRNTTALAAMATNGTTHEEHPTSSQSSEIGGNKAGSPKLSQEEVGWYFVEQYYKTLNKNPEKLHVSPPPYCVLRPIQR